MTTYNVYCVLSTDKLGKFPPLVTLSKFMEKHIRDRLSTFLIHFKNAILPNAYKDRSKLQEKLWRILNKLVRFTMGKEEREKALARGLEKALSECPEITKDY
jgi:hypothetical protein